MAGKLLASTTGTAVEVFTVEDDGFELLSGRERLHVVEGEKEAWNPANVLGTEIFEHAKKLNLHYAHLYGGVEENSENMELEWGKLDGFTRYSNVSAADYHKIRVHMMKTDGWSMDAAGLSQKQMDLWLNSNISGGAGIISSITGEWEFRKMVREKMPRFGSTRI